MIRKALLGALVAGLIVAVGCGGKPEKATPPSETIPIIKDGPKAGGAPPVKDSSKKEGTKTPPAATAD